MNMRMTVAAPTPEVVYPQNTVYWPELPGLILVCVVAIILASFLWRPIRRWRNRK